MQMTWLEPNIVYICVYLAASLVELHHDQPALTSSVALQRVPC